MNHFTHSRNGHPETGGDLLLRDSVLKENSNLSGVRRCEFRIRVAFSVMISAFRRTVSHIFEMSAEEEMRITETGWAVALMAYFHAVWYRPVDKFVGNSMAVFLDGVNPNGSISGSTEISRPNETFVPLGRGLDHFFEQTQAANLVSHISALLWRGCMALVVFPHHGAFSILAHPIRLSKGEF